MNLAMEDGIKIIRNHCSNTSRMMDYIRGIFKEYSNQEYNTMLTNVFGENYTRILADGGKSRKAVNSYFEKEVIGDIDTYESGLLNIKKEYEIKFPILPKLSIAK